jgi:hypothetical protein
VAELKSHANHFFLCSSQNFYGMAVFRHRLKFAESWRRPTWVTVREKPLTMPLDLRNILERSSPLSIFMRSYLSTEAR